MEDDDSDAALSGDRQSRRELRFKEGVLFLLGRFALTLLIASPSILVVMAVVWLRTAQWPDWSPSALGVPVPNTEFLGLNQLWLWLLSRQLGWFVLVAGAVFAWGWSSLDENIRDTRFKRDRRSPR